MTFIYARIFYAELLLILSMFAYKKTCSTKSSGTNMPLTTDN